jgi:uncharacterized membrane protein YqjE
MPQDDLPSEGILESLRRLGCTGLSVLQNRIELFGVEVDQQKARLLRMLILGAFTVLLANTAILVVTATIVLLAEEDARIAVLIGLSLVYIGAAGGMFLFLRKEFKSAPSPFHGTISELNKDREWLDSQK